MNYQPIDLHKKKSDTLIIHCVDPRFQGAYRQLIDSLGEYYDLLVVPGASKAVTDNPSVIDYIKLMHGLHDFETIHIMDHIECGAFGKINNEVADHSSSLKTAASRIMQALRKLRS